MSNPQIELHIQDHGVITLELDADKAPKTVANFLAYVESGHYDQTIFTALFLALWCRVAVCPQA